MADHIAQRLKTKIKTLGAGSKLAPESRLAEEFKVSRTVVREAISQLKAIGILRSLQGSGNYVAPPSETALRFHDLDGLNPVDIMKFFEIRSGLDSGAARLAATRRTKIQLGLLREACVRATAAINPVESAESDNQFHQLIVEATANEHFVSVHRFLSAQFKDGIMFTRRILLGHGLEDNIHREHQAILDAIERKDGEAAAARSYEHILHSQQRLRANLSRLAQSVASH